MSRRIDALLAEYGESHQNATNKAVHWVCVPVIVWTVMAGLWSLPVPGAMGGVNWLEVVLLLSAAYYVSLSLTLTVGIVAHAVFGYWVILRIDGAGVAVWPLALGLFIAAWAGQFWGHKIEGKKPSFLKDIQFLLIGPAWLLAFVYRRLGIPV